MECYQCSQPREGRCGVGGALVYVFIHQHSLWLHDTSDSKLPKLVMHHGSNSVVHTLLSTATYIVLCGGLRPDTQCCTIKSPESCFWIVPGPQPTSLASTTLRMPPENRT